MKLLRMLVMVAMGLIIQGCQTPSEPVDPDKVIENNQMAKMNKIATGTVEVMRMNNKGNGDPNDKIMIADFNAHEEHYNQDDHGTFIFSVLKSDSTIHRVITIDLDWVYVDEISNKAWFKGVVISDTKGCGGNGHGDHADGCEDSGGCSGNESGEHSEGCTGHDSGHDSGCSGDDGETHTDGCGGSGGMGSEGGMGGDGGMRVNGKNCRIGQVMLVKVHDVGTPGTNGDGITWKWFDHDDPNVTNLNSSNVGSWPHLCKKTILNGNLVVHY